MKFLFNYASRSRPQNFLRGIESIVNNFSDENELVIYASLDADDTTMNNESILYMMEKFNIVADFGKSKGKIDAINRLCSKFPDFDVLVNMSDDMIFTKKYFDKDIVSAMPEDLDGYLHFRDTNHKPIDALCTLHIVGRKYYERDNFVYHPAYESVYCDNWNDDVAKKRGKYKFIPEVIFDHIHPAYGKAKMDEQYARTESRVQHHKDRRTYQIMKRTLKKYV